MSRHFLLLGLLILLMDAYASASIIRPVKTESATVIVPDDFPTIQEAINKAADGDTVFVKAGTYYEHLVVNKTISLLGEDSNTTVVDGNWTGVVIDVTRSNVVISGLTVQRSGSVHWENAGIFLDNVENCTVNNNILTENSFAGLVLNQAFGCVVSENRIFDNSGVGITLVGSGFNNLSRNNITENGWSALTLNDEAHNNTISENSMTSNNLAVTGHCINLYRSSSNSIQRNDIAADDNGVRLEYWSDGNSIAGNNIASNTLTGVSVETYSDNNMISGNVISGSMSGVVISNSRYVEILNNTIAHNYGGEWDAGIRLDSAGYSRIHSNLITDNWRGILLYTSSPHVSIYNNNITENEFAVRVASGGSNYLTMSDNVVMNNRGYGIGLTGFGSASNYATVSRNLIINNSDGIALGQYSNYNTILQNNISQNDYGFYIDYSTQNTIWRNNIVDNDQQVYISAGSVNNWDNDYPAGGNYWSNYTGVDLNQDGIGDTPHVIDGNKTDRYPLMGAFHSFNTSAGEYVNVVSNSTVAYFNYEESKGWITIKVRNATAAQTSGFCRVTIPHNLIDPEATWINVVIDDGTMTPLHFNNTLYDNGTHRWIYVAYPHPYSLHEIVIVPEFPSFLILPLFMISTLLTATLYKKSRLES